MERVFVMSNRRKPRKPWLGWTIGEKRVLFPSPKKSRRFQKSIQRKENIEQLIQEGKMK